MSQSNYSITRLLDYPIQHPLLLSRKRIELGALGESAARACLQQQPLIVVANAGQPVARFGDAHSAAVLEQAFRARARRRSALPVEFRECQAAPAASELAAALIECGGALAPSGVVGILLRRRFAEQRRETMAGVAVSKRARAVEERTSLDEVRAHDLAVQIEVSQ